jgi:hypothetical protein
LVEGQGDSYCVPYGTRGGWGGVFYLFYLFYQHTVPKGTKSERRHCDWYVFLSRLFPDGTNTRPVWEALLVEEDRKERAGGEGKPSRSLGALPVAPNATREPHCPIDSRKYAKKEIFLDFCRMREYTGLAFL